MEPPHAWTHFAGDVGATQHSPLAEITPQNVRRLEIAWMYRTGEAQRHSADLAASSFSATPILAAGSLVLCTPWSRVIALDPATGEERWVFDPEMQLEQPPEHRFICRGVAAWHDERSSAGTACADRIVLATNDLRIFALDARTGERCAGFAENGEIRVASDRPLAFPGELQLNGPPAIVGDVVVIGSTVSDHVRRAAPSGRVRAYDARTGAPRWTFDPFANDGAGAANVWADMSIDEERGLVFLSTSSPSLDFDGRARAGDNGYANSIVAVHGATGEVAWHFQVTHHDLWDYDLPSAGLLTTLTVDGRERDALIQTTKQGLVFVLDRATGEPLFPVEERPVPQSDVPGEETSPTQPFPTTMPWLMGLSLAGEQFSADDAWGFTFFDEGRCRARLESHRALGLYGPPSAEGTLTYPWTSGGSNHGMRAYDPERGLLIVSQIRTVGVLHTGEGEEPFIGRAHDSGLVLSPFGAPCLAPPWGELVALDVARQEVVWHVPLGSIEKLGKLPSWAPLPLTFGTPNRGGPMTTGGGVTFVAGTMDDALRAFDTATGEELWRTQLPAGGQATPMTYSVDGRQHVVMAAGGHAWMGTERGDYVVAYALPQP
jgi:quinoprotein glucose dehydrogenase